MRMPCFASSGCNSLFQSAYCVATSSLTTRRMLLNVSVGLNPSGPTSLVSLSICCLIPATRISKNSSKFELKMVRNFTRSINGWVGSWASSRTRRLNSSQLSTRLMKFLGSERSRPGCSVAPGTAGGSGSSTLTLRLVSCIYGKIDNRSSRTRIHQFLVSCRPVSGPRRHRLVPNVFRCRRVDGVFRNVSGVVADPLEAARNEDQIEITAKLVRVLSHPLDQRAIGRPVHVVENIVARNDRSPQLHVFADERVDAVLKHRQCVRVDRF